MAEERIKQLEQELAETQAANEEKDRQLQAANEDKDRVCEEKDRELAAAKAECAGKDRELEDATAQIAKLTTDCESRLEEVKVRFELDKLRAIEQLRNEHVLELKVSVSNKERSKSELTVGSLI